jgi:4-amino-4-deoxy-L-arabinose transferase-like glycosyltransferase
MTPGRLVWLGCALHVVLWSAAGLLHVSPPIDVPEQLVWGAEWVLGTRKLPPLSAWLLEIAWQAGGMRGIAVLAALASGLVYPLVFALGLRMMPPAQAAAGALLLAGVYYFSWPVPEFNHAQAQIPLWAAFFLLFHMCLEGGSSRRQLLLWSALGAVFGLALWAKYSSALLAAPAVLWLLASRTGRSYLATPGPWVAAAAAAAVFAPHAVWLIQADFAPLGYFGGRSARGSSPGRFALTQAVDHLPALVLMALAGLFAARPSALALRKPTESDAFLLVMGLAPVAVTVAVALLLGLKLRDTWGAPMFTLSGLLLVRAVAAAATEVRLRRLAAGSLVLVSAIPAAYMAFVLFGPEWRGRSQRVNWPMTEIGDAVAATCQGTIGRLPAVIVGDNVMGGLAVLALALRFGEDHRPTMIFSMKRENAPWVTDADMRRGTAFIWPASRPGEAMPGALRRMAARLTVPPPAARDFTVPWPRRPGAPGLRFAVACAAGHGLGGGGPAGR